MAVADTAETQTKNACDNPGGGTAFIWQLLSSTASSQPMHAAPRRGSVRVRTLRWGVPETTVWGSSDSSQQPKSATVPRKGNKAKEEVSRSAGSAWIEQCNHGAQEELENLQRATAMPRRHK